MERLLKLPDERENDDSLQTGEKNIGDWHKQAKEHSSFVYYARQKLLCGCVALHMLVVVDLS